MKWIRWQGLIAFLVLVVATAAFVYFFLDGLVKRAIEKTGTLIVRAKVELDDAHVSFSPLGITLKRLQVTNPNVPMTNAVEVAHITFSMDPGALLLHKTIIETMTIEGMRFSTERKTSGALTRKPKEPPGPGVVKSPEMFKLPSLEIPNIHDILEREPLETMKLVDSVQDEIKAEREAWKTRIDALPDKKSLEDYRGRIKEIEKSRKGGLEGILGGAKEAVQVRKDLMKDLDRIKDAQKALKKDIGTLQKRVGEARRAPADDVRRLREKYSLSPEGLSNFTRLLLGGKIAGWTDTGLRWYAAAKPYLDRMSRSAGAGSAEVVKPVRRKGVDVRFKEHRPLPDFLIRTAGVSVDIPAGELTGRVRNITGEQRIVGAPLTFEFKGEKMRDVSRLDLKGEFNRLDASDPRDQFQLDANGYRIQDAMLSDNDQFRVTLASGLADLNGHAEIRKDTMNAGLSAGIRQASLKTGLPEKANTLSKAMADTLSDIKGFKLNVSLTGTPEDHDIGISSDLDRVLKEAVGNQIRKQATQFEQKLADAVHEKVDPQLVQLESRLGSFNPYVNELNARVKIGDELLDELAKSGKKGLKLPF
jgi:uncharacterized protein (TIGR03545 family)